MARVLRTFFVSCTIVFAAIGGVTCLLLHQTDGVNFQYLPYFFLLLFGGCALGGILTLFFYRFMKKQLREDRVRNKEVTELRESISNLQNVADRREEFIASFAHELKTPLTAIIGYADMLRSKDVSPKRRFTAAGYIFSEGKRLEALSLKLMDIIVAGKQSFEKKKFEVGYFIRTVAAVTVPGLSNEEMTLETRWENGTIEVDPDLFKTLLINLVDNARKASHRHDVIELYGKAEDGGYALYVRDHGRGMRQEDLSKITEPFYMIDKSRSRAQNGAGLGLALCQRIAELHGSTLEYTSELGKGTTVRILLKDGEGTHERKKDEGRSRKAPESPERAERPAETGAETDGKGHPEPDTATEERQS